MQKADKGKEWKSEEGSPTAQRGKHNGLQNAEEGKSPRPSTDPQPHRRQSARVELTFGVPSATRPQSHATKASTKARSQRSRDRCALASTPGLRVPDSEAEGRRLCKWPWTEEQKR